MVKYAVSRHKQWMKQSHFEQSK